MRADYSIKSNPNLTEEERLDKHWTENWNKGGNQRHAQWRIKVRHEYKMLRNFAPEPAKGVKVLDGGCGLGEWCILLRNLGYETYGLDLSTSTVQSLRSEFPEMDFSREDIRQTSFENNFFDLYISWGTFEHFENGLQDCFREAHRILKRKGTLIISVPFYNGRIKAIDTELGRPVKDENTNQFYQWRLEEDELASEFETSGFTVKHIEAFNTREGLNRHIHHTYGIPYGILCRLPAVVLSPFVDPKQYAHMLIGVASKN